MALWSGPGRSRALCAFSRGIVRTITYNTTRYAAAQNAELDQQDSLKEEDEKEEASSAAADTGQAVKPKRNRPPKKKRLLTDVSADPPAADSEMQKKSDSPNRVRFALHHLLFNAKKEGTPLEAALDNYSGPFSMIGVEKAFVGVQPEFAVPLFNWAKNQPDFHYKPRMIYSIMNALRRGDIMDQGRKVVESLADDSEAMQLAYSGLFMGYLNSDHPEKADEIRNEMKQRGIDLHSSAYGRLLDLRFKKNGLDGLMELYKEHSAMNWITDAVGCNPLIVRLCKARRAPEAYEIFVETAEKGIQHLESTHHGLINALVAARKIDEALKVAESLIKLGLKSRAIPFRRLINKLAEAKKFDQALMIYGEFVKMASPCGVQLVKHLCEDGDLDRAMSVVKDAHEQDAKVDLDHKLLLIKLCEAKRLEDARLVFDWMVKAGLKPDAEACTALALCGK